MLLTSLTGQTLSRAHSQPNANRQGGTVSVRQIILPNNFAETNHISARGGRADVGGRSAPPSWRRPGRGPRANVTGDSRTWAHVPVCMGACMTRTWACAWAGRGGGGTLPDWCQMLGAS
jgi:hypothetical protein